MVNETPISLMTDGELDAAIAAELFKWTENARHPDLPRRWMVGEPDGAFTCRLPAWSASPEASAQVKAKMRADGWDFTVTALSGYEVWAKFSKVRRGGSEYSTSDLTEERAVAEAALLAVRGAKYERRDAMLRTR